MNGLNLTLPRTSNRRNQIKRTRGRETIARLLPRSSFGLQLWRETRRTVESERWRMGGREQLSIWLRPPVEGGETNGRGIQGQVVQPARRAMQAVRSQNPCEAEDGRSRHHARPAPVPCHQQPLHVSHHFIIDLIRAQ